MARVLAQAPRVVRLAYADDGWAAAHLRIAGRIPVWGGVGDPTPAQTVLEALGLPGLGDAPPEGFLDASLVLTREGPTAAAPLPPRTGPMVSILICTYNRCGLLPNAIQSALAQTWSREVIVIDDGSTDGTQNVIAKFPEVRAFHQPNGGNISFTLPSTKKVLKVY